MAKPKQKPRIGRPPVAEDERKSTHIKVLLTEEQREILERAAKAEGDGVSTWVRRVALKAAGA